MWADQRLLRRGVVSEFDEPVGVGTIVDNIGTQYPFHCTSIADGSRRIANGTPVVFTVAPAHLGRFEARGITPLAPDMSSASAG